MTKESSLTTKTRLNTDEVNRVVRSILHDCARGDPLDLFADRNPVADVEAWEEAIILHGKPSDVVRYASNVHGADIKRLQQAILERGDVWDAYAFAHATQGADISVLQQMVMDKGGGLVMYEFARCIPGADLHAIHNRLVELHTVSNDQGCLNEFNYNTEIQEELKAQLATAIQSKPEGTAGNKKHRPS